MDFKSLARRAPGTWREKASLVLSACGAEGWGSCNQGREYQGALALAGVVFKALARVLEQQSWRTRPHGLGAMAAHLSLSPLPFESASYMCVHTHTHRGIHTCTHTHRHRHTCTHLHTYTCTYTQRHSHICTHIHTYTCMYKHRHTHTEKQAYTSMNTHTDTLTHACTYQLTSLTAASGPVPQGATS